MRDPFDRPHSRLKKNWLERLKAGAGTLVVAVAFVGSSPVEAAQRPGAGSVVDKVQHARDALRKGLSKPGGEPTSLYELAWWGKGWGNGGWGWHPGWHNWPNWHNWHNWPNWPNWGNG